MIRAKLPLFSDPITYLPNTATYMYMYVSDHRPIYCLHSQVLILSVLDLYCNPPPPPPHTYSIIT